jgi:hypothetical protein
MFTEEKERVVVKESIVEYYMYDLEKFEKAVQKTLENVPKEKLW